jgi:hypothetical protein
MYEIAIIVTDKDNATDIRTLVASLDNKRSKVEKLLHNSFPELIGVEDNRVLYTKYYLKEDNEQCVIRIYLAPNVSTECLGLSGDGIYERIPNVLFTEFHVVSGETIDDYTFDKMVVKVKKMMQGRGVKKYWIIDSSDFIPEQIKFQFNTLSLMSIS